jgi:hypothetical protein
MPTMAKPFFLTLAKAGPDWAGDEGLEAAFTRPARRPVTGFFAAIFFVFGFLATMS